MTDDEECDKDENEENDGYTKESEEDGDNMSK
jgi:hypothetical protein